MRMDQKSVAGSFMVLKERVVWYIWTLTIKSQGVENDPNFG